MVYDIPSDSDDDRLEIDNGVTEVDEVDQANPMHRQTKRGTLYAYAVADKCVCVD